jgi:2-polyprenyl-3-methyl-5-hydroxy-6-metoxy-1,4-benzoquinol methylase
LNWFSKEKIDQKMLEIGCGDGFWLDILRNLGFSEIHGLEPSKHYIDYCRQKGLTVFHSTVEKFKTEAKFDWILFFDVLEHLEDPVEVLRRTNKLLNKKGKVFINIPVYDSFYEKTQRFVGITDKKFQSTAHDPTHIKYPSGRDVDQWLEEANFGKVISAHIYNPYPFLGFRFGRVSNLATRLTFFGKFGRFYSVVGTKT